MNKEQIKRIAYAIFDDYNTLVRSQSKSIVYPTFESQPESLQESCFSQARSIWDKMAKLGFMIVHDNSHSASQQQPQLTCENIEALAQMEHERWSQERIKDGWSYGTVKDTNKKITPYLVPYEKLP